MNRLAQTDAWTFFQEADSWKLEGGFSLCAGMDIKSVNASKSVY